jgi:tungstate transport system ATP-binding protein
MSDVLLEARDLAVTYPGRDALDVPRLTLRRGEILTLVGPNGSGKSTLLRVLGLLTRPDRGRVVFDGEEAPWESPRRLLELRRRTSAVLQEPLLCRMNVQQNVALGLRFRRLPRAEVEGRISSWLERLHIDHLRERPAAQLSGGEAQRVSLARALVLEPELLLLDEPFASLDAPTRHDLLAEFAEILGQARVTTVFATHDRGEALALGDRVAVLLGGRLAQLGPAEEIFVRPASEEVARFVGVETLIPGRVAALEEGLVHVDSPAGPLEVVGECRVGDAVVVSVRPEEITLLLGGPPPRSSARNVLRGRVAKIVPADTHFRVEVDCGVSVVARVTRPSFRELELDVGREIGVVFKALAAHLIRRSDGEAERR